MSKYSARFDGLKPGTSYDIQVATELAGKTVVQTRHTFKTLQAETETASTTTDTQARGCMYILPLKPFLPNEILRKFLHIFKIKTIAIRKSSNDLVKDLKIKVAARHDNV